VQDSVSEFRCGRLGRFFLPARRCIQHLVPSHYHFLQATGTSLAEAAENARVGSSIVEPNVELPSAKPRSLSLFPRTPRVTLTASETASGVPHAMLQVDVDDEWNHPASFQAAGGCVQRRRRWWQMRESPSDRTCIKRTVYRPTNRGTVQYSGLICTWLRPRRENVAARSESARNRFSVTSSLHRSATVSSVTGARGDYRSSISVQANLVEKRKCASVCSPFCLLNTVQWFLSRQDHGGTTHLRVTRIFFGRCSQPPFGLHLRMWANSVCH